MARAAETIGLDRLLGALDSLDEGLGVFDGEFRLVFANRRFLEMHRRIEGAGAVPETLETVLGQVVPLIPGDGPNFVRRMLERARRADGRPYEQRTREGRVFRYHFARLGGGLTAFAVQSVTALRAHERRADEIAGQLATILEHLAEGVSIFDPDNCLVLANEGYVSMYGYPEEYARPGTRYETFLRRFAERTLGVSGAMLDASVQAELAIFQRLRRTLQEHVQIETLADGRAVEVRRNATPQGHVVSTYVDVTQRVAAERELAQSNRRMSAVLLGAMDGIITLDRQGTVQGWNRTGAALLGLSRADRGARPFADFLDRSEDRAGFEAAVRPMVAAPQHDGRAGQRVELALRSANGRRFPAELSLTVAGEPLADSVTVFVRDLTDRREMEDAMARQREALVLNERLSALGSMLANVAHELNNPLSAVIAQSELMAELAEGTELAERAARVRTAAERCARIVQTFLGMARQKPAEPRRFSPLRPLDEACDLLAYGFRATGIDLEVDAGAVGSEITGDPTQVGQVLVNLLLNAQQAVMDWDGLRRVTVTLTEDPGGRGVAYGVADTGPGIPADRQARIFEPFFTTKPGGTGVGLAIAHAIADAHDGSLTLDENWSGGAAFRFWLPAEPGRGAEANPAAIGPAEAAGARVLVVDDEPDVAEALAGFLGRMGCAVETVGGGYAALERLANGTYEAVISDIRMPDMNGVTLYERAVARDPSLERRFGFFSGDALSSGIRERVEGTGRPLMAKPFDRAAVERLMAELLAG